MDVDDASVASGPAARGKGKAAAKATTSRGKKALVSMHCLQAKLARSSYVCHYVQSQFNDESDESDSASSEAPKKKAPAKKAPATRKAPAKKAAAPSQSQLNFAPSRSGSRATSKAAPSRSKKAADSDDDASNVIDLDDSGSDDPPPKKTSSRKR